MIVASAISIELCLNPSVCVTSRTRRDGLTGVGEAGPGDPESPEQDHIRRTDATTDPEPDQSSHDDSCRSAHFDLDDAGVADAEADDVMRVAAGDENPLPRLRQLLESDRRTGVGLGLLIGAVGHDRAADQHRNRRHGVRV